MNWKKERSCIRSVLSANCSAGRLLLALVFVPGKKLSLHSCISFTLLYWGDVCSDDVRTASRLRRVCGSEEEPLMFLEESRCKSCRGKKKYWNVAFCIDQTYGHGYISASTSWTLPAEMVAVLAVTPRVAAAIWCVSTWLHVMSLCP